MVSYQWRLVALLPFKLSISEKGIFRDGFSKSNKAIIIWVKLVFKS